MRRDKMMFFGLAEGTDKSPEEQVREHLRAVESPAAGKITEAVRLGARAEGPATDAARSRPVRVSFSSAGAVYEVFKACKALREQRKVFVDRDLTEEQRAVRASLMAEYKQLRENGFRAFWRGERLFYTSGQGSRAMEVKPGDEVPAAGPGASSRRST